ncbi:hypothetical protein, partial [Falsiroseomonas oryzae]|uniref:hypothetical protein n=1 Tax=Falsiroseomonas oryzae TaxID=2766473 RepID=UPI0022EB2569
TAVGAVAGAVAGAGAGGLVGGGAGNVAGEALAITGEAIARTAKAIWKWSRGTKGEHRQQAALALYFCATTRPAEIHGKAAIEALGVILGPNLPKVMKMDEHHAIPEIMEHLKSVSWFTW